MTNIGLYGIMSRMDIWNNIGYYSIIAVDPPWPTGKTGIRKSRPSQNTMLGYKTMNLEEIAQLDITSIAAPNSICFLWTIQKFLLHALFIIRDWGFDYKLTMTWDKSNGMCLLGFHWRTEFIVVGMKGSWDTFRFGKAIPTLLTAKSSYHSAKPDKFYKMVEHLGQPRADIFARKLRDGWDCWGDEV